MVGQTLDLINQLQQLYEVNEIDAQSQHKVLRKQACDLAYNIFRELEEPGDLLTRLIYQVGGFIHYKWSKINDLVEKPVENGVIATAIDLNIFEHLMNAGCNVSSKDIASQTGAEDTLVYRILRFLAAHRFVDEVDVDLFKANNTTKAFTTPQAVSGFRATVDAAIPAWQAIPAHLKSIGYKNPTDPFNAPIQYAFKSDKHFFDILIERNVMSDFQTFMSNYRTDRAELLDIYPADEYLLEGFDSTQKDAILFVDVGGGRGHEIDKFLEKYPQDQHRMILQDLPHIVKDVEGARNKNVIAYDFFTPQPIKGARCYHFRMIFHDWPDDHCIKILNNTASAMIPGYSKILISDVVLPDKGTTSWPARSDLTMMTMLAAMERSASQWKTLLERAGLRITRIHEKVPESVIEAELA